MDRKKENALVSRAECACAVLGNPATAEFLLVDLDAAPMSAESISDARQRGFELVGVMGIKDGIPDAIAEPRAGALALMCAAVMPFVAQYATKLGTTKSDGAGWLTRLHALPDPRES
jgi:hypothetical protein